MLPVIEYTLLGLSLAAPIGPLNCAAIRRGLSQGFWGTFSVRFGGIIGNFLCLVIAYFGLGSFLTIPWVKMTSWILGSMLLIIMGVRSIRASFKEGAFVKEEDSSNRNAILLGLTLGIANPFAVVWWLGVFGATMSNTDVADLFTLSDFLTKCMIFVGIFGWTFFLALSMAIGKHFMTEKRFQIISVIAGLSLVYFGCVYGWQAFQSLSQI